MTNRKSIGMAYLTHGQLGNHNAGEGGSQLSNLKMYDNKPYISGQALRHAVRDALRTHTTEGVDCTPTDSCGDIENCKICDKFGYMNTDLNPNDEDGHQPKRTGPLRVTPALGVYPKPVTTDMIVQYGVGGSVKKESDQESHGNSIAYREIVENTYQGAWMLDEYMVGRREHEEMYDSRDTGHRYERKVVDEVPDEERIQRINTLIDSLRDHCNLAGQARHMADFMPDLAVAAELPTYNQRITNALQVREETNELNIQAFESICKDITSLGGNIYVAGTYNANVISNWDDLFETVEQLDSVEKVDSVTECYERLKYD